MFGRSLADEFVNAPAQGGETGGDGKSWLFLLVILAGIGAFVAWARFFEIEEVTRGVGRVVSTMQVQVVQSLEPGIVRSIDVREGDTVVAGQALMQVDDTAASSQRGELLEQEAALLAEEARLQAEVAMNRSPVFPEELKARAPNAILAEMDVLESRFRQLDNELAVLESKLTQKQAALDELRSHRAKLEEVIRPLSEEMTLTEQLVANGAVPRIELLRLQSRLAEMKGELAVSLAQEPNLLAGIEQARNEIAVAKSGYVLTARQRLAKLGLELAVVREGLRAAEDRVVRTLLRAPVQGVVNAVNVTTVGEVVEPGKPLVEIVPGDDKLHVEVDIPPKDVAFIQPGERASVKISAYDYLVYGALEGKVTRIGADTVQRPDGHEYFRVTVEMDRADFSRDGQVLPISPGMTATVDIQTGRRTVLSYLLEPLLKIRTEALRER
ncbi:HlyD family type I secretion periplasmic adaptor subunit [Seohaeicola zhoushanensis]|uniref:Membrane fusion protein (MFP) family protein n=1 Tax=Seohaeicola zhoushanensis TaxID=1569283 RepID=A0A8J3H0I3_9RHOB|nr:HlyD family type I secretion periplasmic adaptor subunit [Seohaeicola zhoushanensis]GHF68067.1 HlyD family type I secretion membrane fusion protein [Seohaeicola zhoushanensis]